MCTEEGQAGTDQGVPCEDDGVLCPLLAITEKQMWPLVWLPGARGAVG